MLIRVRWRKFAFEVQIDRLVVLYLGGGGSLLAALAARVGLL
jgi:hypothetical protein